MNKIESSETIRKTTFNLETYKKNLVNHKKKINIDFLEWFIGFAEGDGSFIVSNNRLFFIINQKEEKILHSIRTNLGFGKVSIYKTYSRFIVADRKNIDRLISIFNGNLVLYKTNSRFVSWLNARNTYCNEKIQYSNKNELLSFKDNAWLSGFIDAEGCFNSLRKKNLKCKIGFTVNLRFIVDQKSEISILKKIQFFLQSGNIQKRLKIENMYRIVISHRKSHEILIQYLNRYPLRTIKKVSYFRFCSILRYIQDLDNYPWTQKGLKKLERLIKNT
jgi:hypothetical protein